MIRVRTTVTVTEVDDVTNEPLEGVKPEGFVVGNEHAIPAGAPSWVIDSEVQRMLVATMPAAYLESDKRWAKRGPLVTGFPPRPLRKDKVG